MHDLPPTPPERARPRWWLRGLLLLALASTAWLGWREYDHRAAIREARAAGFFWHSVDAIDRIREDWRAALRVKRWTEPDRILDLGERRDLARLRPLLLRLRPTALIADGRTDANLYALQGLSGLRSLHVRDCTALQNVDALKGLPSLKRLSLYNLSALQHVDALKGLSRLQDLNLNGCTALQNVDGLKGLSGLEALDLRGGSALQSVDGLKGLSGLRYVHLVNCPKLPAAAVAALRAALPQANIRSDFDP